MSNLGDESYSKYVDVIFFFCGKLKGVNLSIYTRQKTLPIWTTTAKGWQGCMYVSFFPPFQLSKTDQ